ncbi:MAG: tripartite tricarboxylate transporter TctB family protein [Burkholderiales bacterium]
MRLSRDTVAALLCLALSLFLLYLTLGLPQSPLVPIGPDFYPRIVLGVIALLSVLLIVADVLAARRSARAAQAPAAPPAAAPKNYRLVVITFMVFGLYVTLLPGLGYRISTFLFVLVLQPLLERPASPRGWIIVFVIAAATALVTFLIFEKYLQVLLPRGTLTGI